MFKGRGSGALQTSLRGGLGLWREVGVWRLAGAAGSPSERGSVVVGFPGHSTRVLSMPYLWILHIFKHRLPAKLFFLFPLK